MKPLLILNFKTYKNSEGSGEMMALAFLAETIALEKKTNIAIAIDPVNLYKVCSSVSIPVFSQHIDHTGLGANTGHIIAEHVKGAGAYGTLLNHSERRVVPEILEKTVQRCREVGLKAVLCCSNVDEAAKLLKLNPDYIALEEPKLIGGKKPISELMPEEVKRFAEVVKRHSTAVPLCGAGISTGKDVAAAIKLGVEGVLVSSAFVNAEEPKRVLGELVGGLYMV